MRLTLRTTIAIAAAMLASACSSLGGVELQDGAEGRFTAGDDGDPSSPASGDAPSPDSASDESDGSSGVGEGNGPLEPPPPDGDTDGRTSASDTATEGTGDETSATDPSGSGTDDANDDAIDEATSDGGIDDGTTSADPQTNGAASTSDSGECTDLECLPPCDRQWATWCDQQCDDVAEPTACATEDGIVVSCDMGVWTCTG